MYKVWCVIVGIAMLLPVWMLAQPNLNPAADTLAPMRDKSRPLLVFYPKDLSDQGPGREVERQRALLEGHTGELKERDVVVVFVPVPSASVVEESEPRQGMPVLHGSPDLYRGLRTQFHVENSRFAVVLVGKDGGEKFRSHEPVTIEELDALIDAMPMRQQEVRDGRHAK